MTARIRLTVEEAQAVKAMDNVRRGAKGVTDEYKQLVRTSKELEREGKKAFDNTRTPMERYRQRLRALRDALRTGKIDQDTYNRSVEKLRTEMRGATSGFSQFSTALSKIGVGTLSAAGAVSTLAAALSRAVQFQQELNEAATRSANVQRANIDPLRDLALLPGGQQNIIAARQLAQFENVPIAQVAQILQPALSQPGATLASAGAETRRLLRLREVGIDPEAIAEAIAQAGLVGDLTASDLGRRIFGAGQASSRTPGDLARALPTLNLFGNEIDFWVDATTQLTNAFGRESQTYVKALNTAIGPGGALERGNLERLGLGVDSTREQRISALIGAGAQDPRALRELGITELRQQQAVLAFTTGADQFRALQRSIDEKLEDPNLIAGRIDELRNIPLFRDDLLRREQEVAQERIRLFDEGAAARDLRQRRRATELLEQGRETTFIGGERVQDGRARLTAWGLLDDFYTEFGDIGRGAAADEYLRRIAENSERPAIPTQEAN